MGTSEGKRRKLERQDFGEIHWHHIEQCLAREKTRESVGGSKKTKLIDECVHLNTWSKMWVNYAKYIFDCSTISEIFSHLCTKLNVKPPVSVSSATKGQLLFMESKNVCLGLMSCKLLYVRSTVSLSSSTCSLFETLLFMTYINEIFNEFMLNPHCYVNLVNFDNVHAYLMLRLDYFCNWRKSTADIHKNLAPQTWRSLRLCINGFLTHCFNTLHADSSVQYIPVLHANTSALEALFSYIRGITKFNGSTTTTYSDALSCLSIEHLSKALATNKCYDQSDCGDLRKSSTWIATSSPFLKWRESIFAKLKYRENIDPAYLSVVPPVPAVFANFFRNNSIFGKILDEENFLKYIWASTGGTYEKWLHQFVQVISSDEMLQQEQYFREIFCCALNLYYNYVSSFADDISDKITSFDQVMTESFQCGRLSFIFL